MYSQMANVFEITNRHLGSHSVHYATAVATPMIVDEWVQIKIRNRPHVAEEDPVPKTVAEKLKIVHSDKSVVFRRAEESKISEPRTLFEHDIGLINNLRNQ